MTSPPWPSALISGLKENSPFQNPGQGHDTFKMQIFTHAYFFILGNEFEEQFEISNLRLVSSLWWIMYITTASAEMVLWIFFSILGAFRFQHFKCVESVHIKPWATMLKTFEIVEKVLPIWNFEFKFTLQDPQT